MTFRNEVIELLGHTLDTEQNSYVMINRSSNQMYRLELYFIGNNTYQYEIYEIGEGGTGENLSSSIVVAENFKHAYDKVLKKVLL